MVKIFRGDLCVSGKGEVTVSGRTPDPEGQNKFGAPVVVGSNER